MSNKKYLVKDILKEISMGPFGSNIKVECFTETGFPLLDGSNLTGVKLKEKSFKYVTEEKARSLGRAIAKRNDIVITHRGTLGQVSYIPKDSKYPEYLISQSQFRVTFDDKVVNPIYIAYYFRTNEGQKKLLSFASYVGVPALAQATTNFKEVELILPNIDIQNKVAEILCELDEKIENNEIVNRELEEVAKDIYDYWFLQFDFSDENGRPYKSSGGKMVWNEDLQREIPIGWEIGRLKNFIQNDKGGDWGKDKEEGNYNKKVTCLRGADFPAVIGAANLEAPERYIFEKNSYKILEDGNLIIEISGGSPTQSTGRMCYINENVLRRFENPIITSNFCKAIELNDKKYMYWFYVLWSKLYESNVFFKYEGKTTGIKNLLFEMLCQDYKIVIPDDEVIEKYNEKVKHLFETIQKNQLENQELAALRDFLLPLLMNGQVSFRED